MSVYRCNEPGWCLVALPDGRRGLWYRETREKGHLVGLELCAGRAGDDHYVDVRLYETLTHSTLDTLAHALSATSGASANRADQVRGEDGPISPEDAVLLRHAEASELMITVDALQKLAARLRAPEAAPPPDLVEPLDLLSLVELLDPKAAAAALVSDLSGALDRAAKGDEIRVVMRALDGLRSELGALASQADQAPIEHGAPNVVNVHAEGKRGLEIGGIVRALERAEVLPDERLFALAVRAELGELAKRAERRRADPRAARGCLPIRAELGELAKRVHERR